jgi:branched-chain amino acid transport system ATP-binding protein
MTVRENVHFGAELSDRSRNTRRKAAADAMELLGLGALAERAVSDLSYGNRKIVELARALAADPRILLLDEPMAGLDTHEKRQFVDTLDMVFDNTECAVLLIEHDMFAVGALTHRVLVIDAGKTIASGTLQEVSAEQRVIDAYLGA